MYKPNHKIKVIFSSLIIGLVGSALWELILSPLSHFFINTLFEKAAIAFTFIGNLYAKSIPRSDAISLLISIRSMVICILIFAFIRHLIGSKHTLKVHIFMSIFVILFTFDFVLDLQLASVSKQILTNIEIVSPYISDVDYKKLKSDFYAMNTYSSYIDLKESINNIARANNLILK